jgi:nicotinate phosphoribosyltransferase
LLATKATRVISAAANKSVIDFGARRSHGKDAALAAAYSSYLVGAIGTSNVLAGSVFDIPVFGTMAHSFVQAFESEAEAFKAYLKEYPNNSTLLIDTYDPLAAVPLVAEIAKTLPHKIQAVRIDSGNLQEVAVAVRKALDEYGLSQTQIILSGDLDEQAIAELEIKKVPVDGYGVGTKMDISLDTPFLEMVYKLSHIEHHGKGRSTAKASPNKANLPGRKQIYRQYKHDLAVEDIIGLEGEELPGVPLLRPIIYNGRAVNQSTTLKQQRQRYSKRLKSFPLEMLSVGSELKYPVRLSDEMRRLIESIEA